MESAEDDMYVNIYYLTVNIKILTILCTCITEQEKRTAQSYQDLRRKHFKERRQKIDKMISQHIRQGQTAQLLCLTPEQPYKHQENNSLNSH